VAGLPERIRELLRCRRRGGQQLVNPRHMPSAAALPESVNSCPALVKSDVVV
jgi:hypothetical protein